MGYPLNVMSEVGKLRTVLLHRPGREIENLIPDQLTKLLFDDIPYLQVMQQEHDYFAQALRNQGAEVLYLEKLVEEVLWEEGVKDKFVEQILCESNIHEFNGSNYLREFLISMSNEKLVETVMSGLRKDELPKEIKHHLFDFVSDQYPFYLDPMPNLYFTRDPSATIGNGISINRMRWEARRRESIFMQYIIQYHPQFSSHEIPIWFNREGEYSIEGGDQIVLSEEVLFVGVSERTSAVALEILAMRLLNSHEGWKAVVAVEIPKTRSFMHLDTVFTMVDVDKFTIHPDVLGQSKNMGIYVLKKEEDGSLNITVRYNLIDTLKETLDIPDIDLISCGNGDSIAAAREQWNDGSNTLAVAPGVVVTYDRNSVSNQALREHGVKVIEISGSELGRGRGGPRCMSMPLFRESVI